MTARNGNNWSVADLAQSIAPTTWKFPNDWFFWPPDVFAFTSSIFQRTGCYSLVVAESIEPPDEASQDTRSATVKGKWRGNPEWQANVERTATQWLKDINRILSEEVPTGAEPSIHHVLKDNDFLKVIERIGVLSSQVTLEELRLLAGRPGDLANARTLCEDLIFMHAVADEACSGFGLPNAPLRNYALARYLANLLLTTWGSLSSISKHYGTVLPKMRTPRSGLTLRSLSHHVTFHTSEVEVMWRATPWVNIHENTLNILCLPWPKEVSEQCFEPERETFESGRYFSYTPPKRDDLSHIDDFVKLVQHASETVSRLHMVVFPETALARDDYKRLMWRLREAHLDGRLEHVPMIIAGVQSKTQKECRNEVRLAAYFAGQWYELSQRKHHRWKLNESQIRQYGLQGRLSTARNWYENASIAQRRLTFLAPNGWLILCPLICEDLAQLEPVSELIRGVGPTLLISLLMDGPQLKERWSARYASVFADDPGTAVLTLTSLGMSTRSRRLEGDKPDEKPSRAIGLWKDAIRGWRTLELDEDKDAQLLTICADWTEEHTADGRTDHGFAAAFKFDGVRSFSLAELRKSDEPRSELLGQENQGVADLDPSLGKGDWLRSWEDIRELSAATYALDAAIQLEGGQLSLIIALLLGNIVSEPNKRVLPPQILEIINLVTMAEVNPERVGVAAQSAEGWPTHSLRLAASEFEARLSSTTEAEGTASYWKRLTEEAIEQLETQGGLSTGSLSDEERMPRSVSLAILAALHYRIEKMRRKRARQHGEVENNTASADGSLEFSEAADLLEKIEAALYEYE